MVTFVQLLEIVHRTAGSEKTGNLPT